MIYLLIGLAAVVIIQELFLLLLFSPSVKPDNSTDIVSRVAVLVAARNEADSIEKCLKALLVQGYDENNYEILVGDDQSTDRTAEIVKELSARHPVVHYYSVPENYASLAGKAKVIAWLAKQTEAEYLLITDADIVTGKRWIKTMAGTLSEDKYDFVNGITGIGKSKFQDMEWMYALGSLKVLSDIWRPVTGIGNNMGFTRSAYEALGGYEKIGFSLTEDHAILEAAHVNGYGAKQLFSPDALAESLPVSMPLPYLEQRKRWMTGAFKVPMPVRILLGIQSLFLVIIALLVIYAPFIAVGLLVTRMAIRSYLFVKLFEVAGKSISPINEVWFEIFSGIMNMIAFLYFILPGNIAWKGRKYKMHPA